jgi:predicted acetyltransferase
MSLEIRPIRDEELPAFVETLTTGFLERPDQGPLVEALRELWDLSRTWSAFDDGRIVSTFRSWPTELTVPGLARIPAGGIAAVTVLPTHRRRGILRRTIEAEHAAARERGEVVSLLYASEYPIYGRFGYGMGCRQAIWALDTRATGFHGQPVGTVEIAPANEATRDAMIAVHETWRKRRHGEIRQKPTEWDFDLALRREVWGEPWKGFVALHRDTAGEIDGYVRYHADGHWEHGQPKATLVVDDFHALDDAAESTLWRFLAGIDWVATVRIERRSPSDRLPWRLTNARAARLVELADGMFVRVLDVPRALESRTYERADRLVLEIVDPVGDATPTRVELDATEDGARCRPTTAAPDLTIHAGALGAAYLGGSRLSDAVLADGADEHRPGALARAERLLRTAEEPWCSTFF